MSLAFFLCLLVFSAFIKMDEARCPDIPVEPLYECDTDKDCIDYPCCTDWNGDSSCYYGKGALEVSESFMTYLIKTNGKKK
jgi:hypothetical protein